MSFHRYLLEVSCRISSKVAKVLKGNTGNSFSRSIRGNSPGCISTDLMVRYQLVISEILLMERNPAPGWNRYPP